MSNQQPVRTNQQVVKTFEYQDGKGNICHKEFLADVYEYTDTDGNKYYSTFDPCNKCLLKPSECEGKDRYLCQPCYDAEPEEEEEEEEEEY